MVEKVILHREVRERNMLGEMRYEYSYPDTEVQ